MNLIRLITILMFSVVCFQSTVIYAQYLATIPLNERRMPSDDLLYNNKIMTANEAHLMKVDGQDLSLLNPAQSVLWDDQRGDLDLDENLPISSGGTGDYKAPILSATGLFRFNIETNGNTAIIHLDKKLHTILLRKNILRLMGYKIPQMKWLDEFSIRFSNIQEMNNFLESLIPRATLGAAERWIKEKDETSLTVTLKDIAVSIPMASDHYNLSLGVPPKTLSNRTLRALVIPYALTDLGESANSFEWNVGRIENDSIVLPHFARGYFATTLNDAKWSMRRLSNLSREDISQAVKKAYFPEAVATLLIEKLIARQNSLAELLQTEYQVRDFQTEVLLK